MSASAVRDPFAGWTFLTDQDGNAHVRTPKGIEHVYSQTVVADTLLSLVHQAHTAPDTLSDYSVAYWRRVVGEERWKEAMAVLALVVPI